ncbi:MAG: transglycosylase SLT domain-containing protein [Deltaproteobacteria bacterium]|nr:transglycosylase SLT domain-containing protein [Deltaproteobacteria bacterium]
MKVFVDQDYAEAKALLKKAGISLARAKAAMATGKKEESPDAHAKRMVRHVLAYKAKKGKSRDKLRAYYSRLTPRNDDRLVRAAGEKALDRLLKECLKKHQNRLRDALGHLYNYCLDENAHTLTPKNIHFVNGVFYAFVREAKKTDLAGFHLDRVSDYGTSGTSGDWKKILGTVTPGYVAPLEKAIKKHGNKRYPVDPLLFMALMRRESLFDPRAVSYVGAAGLTQIMPKTGKDLGMEHIFMPAYFDDAVTLFKEERRLKRQAVRVLLRINDENGLDQAKRARALKQKGMGLERKRKRLFARYRKELLNRKRDERLQPENAITFGYKYFGALMRQQKGDISLALASYNAGPHRIKQYQGIPPFEETVLFRNKVLEFYREYLKKAREKRQVGSGR